MEERIPNAEAPKTLSVLLHLPVLFLWLVVFWHLLIFELRIFAYAIGIAFLFVAIGARFLPRRHRPRLARTRNFFFYTVGFCGLIPLFHLAFLTQRALTAALCVTAALIAFAFRSRRWTGILSALFCAVIPLLGDLPAFIIAGLFYAALFLAVAWLRPRWLDRPYPVFLLLGFLALSAYLHDFYKGQPPDESSKILSQRGVKAIYLSSDAGSPITAALGNECRLAVENCDGSLILGGRERRRGLFLFRDGELIKTPIKQVSDFIDLDCKSGILWAGEFRRSVIRGIDAQTGTGEKRVLGLPFGGLSRVRLDRQKDRLFASRDDTPRILMLDLKTEQPLVANFSHAVVDFDFSNELDALFVARWGGVFYRYGLTSLEAEGRLVSPDWLIHFDLDFDNLTGYITKFYDGRVLKVNLSTLEVINSVKLEPGLRFPLLDKKQGLLFVSNFITGQCTALDADTLVVKDSRRFGARLRATALSRDGSTLYAPSAQGAFAWDLSTIR